MAFFGIIKNDLEHDVRDGGLFTFLNQRPNRIKLLYWDIDGIAIWMKKQRAEGTHSNTFTEVGFGRTLSRIVDETRSTHF